MGKGGVEGYGESTAEACNGVRIADGGEGSFPVSGGDGCTFGVTGEAAGALGDHAFAGDVDGDEVGAHFGGGFEDCAGFTCEEVVRGGAVAQDVGGDGVVGEVEEGAAMAQACAVAAENS